MKILLTIDFDPYIMESGGVGVNVRYLIKEFQRSGHAATLGYPKQFGAKAISGIPTIVIGEPETYHEVFDQFDFIIFIGTMTLRPIFLAGPMLLINEKKKFIVYFRATSVIRPFHHRFDGMSDAQVAMLDKEMNTIIRSPYSIVISNSQAMKDDLASIYPSAHEKDIRIVYPGTVWPIHMPDRRITNKFTFITIGRLSVDKGVLLAFEAFKNLYHELSISHPSLIIELKIIGTGELEGTLRALIEEFRLSRAVKLCGRVKHDDIFAELASSTALVHPALTEPFGNVVVEALGMGLPVIATDFEGPKEILEDGKFGKLIPRMNAWALKNAMKELVIDQKVHRAMLSQAKKSDARRKYTIAKQAASLLQIISRANH
jgi:glycosyltransferase involved in cell wall biosynthesis